MTPQRCLLIVGAPWAIDVAARIVRACPHIDWRILAGRLDPPQVEQTITDADAHYVFFLNYSHRVSDAVTRWETCVNVHCTDLPYGRGGHPIENLIREGHHETVLTAHRMTVELDAGPIYAKSGPVSLEGSKADILARFVDPCAALIVRIVTEQMEPRPQEGTPTYFHRLSEAEYRSVWGIPA